MDFETEDSIISPADELLSMINLHNEGLDYVRSGLQDTFVNSHDYESIESLAQDLTTAFLIKQKQFQHYQLQEISEMVQSSFELERDVSYKIKSKAGHQSVLLSTATYFADYNFSASTINILSDIENLTVNDELSLDESISELNKIIDQISLDAATKPENDIDILVLFSAAYIARESLEYWHNNIESWYELSSTKSKVGSASFDEIMWFSWREVALRDVGGAVGGCVAGAVVGAVLASGPGCVTTGLIMGTGMSVASGVYQVLDHVLPD